MGLLKLRTIYKKHKKESSPPIVPLIESPSIKLNLNLDETLSQPTQQAHLGNLFDDILTELKSKPDGEEDTIKSDYSLVLALSQQLSLEEQDTEKQTPATHEPETNERSFVFGTDSIYSSYLQNVSAIESSSNSNSMFDPLMNKNTKQVTLPATQPTTAVSQVVLDSDISDSDEGSVCSEDSEIAKKASKKRSGPQPIMQRRGATLNVQRKAEVGCSQRVDSNQIDENVIERMKDRHRNQAKTTALCRQQLEEELTMVPQSYGFPPNMMMAIEPMYYPLMYFPPAHQYPSMHNYSPMNTYSPNIQYVPYHNKPTRINAYSNDYESHHKSQPAPAELLPNTKHISTAAYFNQEEKPMMMKSTSVPTQRASRSICRGHYRKLVYYDNSQATTPSLDQYPVISLESIPKYESSSHGSNNGSKKPTHTDIRISRSTPNLKKKKSTSHKETSHLQDGSLLRHRSSEPAVVKRPLDHQQLNTEWKKIQEYL